MEFYKWFKKQNLIVQILLLVLPLIGWIVEIILRGSKLLKDQGIKELVIFLVYLLFGWAIILGVIDAICWVLNKKLFLYD